MSLSDGMAAMNLQMPPRVPRTEYSAHVHWDLVNRVIGSNVNPSSNAADQEEAFKAFVRAWNYDFFFGTYIKHQIFGNVRTTMGHAAYAAGGVDFEDQGIQCPFKTPEEVLNFDPWQTFGSVNQAHVVKEFNEHYEKNRQFWPECVTMTGIYVTCVSGLIDLFGWDMLLMAAGTDLERFGQMTDRYASWMQQYFDALALCDAEVVMVHDDIVWSSGAFMSPAWYRKHVFPNYKRYFKPLHEAHKKVMYTSDGDYTEFIDDIAATGVHGFVMEPMTDMKYIAEKYGKTHVFIGNADTRILLYGTRSQIRQEVQRCMDIGKNCPGFFLAVGNHIPPNTPVENALYYNDVYMEMSRR